MPIPLEMRQDTVFSMKKTLRIRDNVVPLNPALIMGVLNMTPDSFSDGGELLKEEALVRKAGEMLMDGATILDIGGYSTRPGAAEVSPQEELNRVIPAITAIRSKFPEAYLSVDTFRASVAQEAITAGADMVNDVSGGSLDPDMFPTVAALHVPYILMHMRGTPATMSGLSDYDDLLLEVWQYFRDKLHEARSYGMEDIVIDPGFGFAKTIEQNYIMLKNLAYFHSLELPLLIGVSRKSMIWKKLQVQPAEAVNGTSVLNTYALLQGASVLRVHDVKEAAQTIALVNELTNADYIKGD